MIGAAFVGDLADNDDPGPHLAAREPRLRPNRACAWAAGSRPGARAPAPP